MHSFWGEGIECDGDGLVLVGFFQGGGDASAVDDDVVVFGEVSGVELHGFVARSESGEVLFAALCVHWAEGPEGGLGVGESGVGAVARGKGAGEFSLLGEVEEFGSGEAAAVTINLDVVSVLEL